MVSLLLVFICIFWPVSLAVFGAATDQLVRNVSFWLLVKTAIAFLAAHCNMAGVTISRKLVPTHLLRLLSNWSLWLGKQRRLLLQLHSIVTGHILVKLQSTFLRCKFIHPMVFLNMLPKFVVMMLQVVLLLVLPSHHLIQVGVVDLSSGLLFLCWWFYRDQKDES